MGIFDFLKKQPAAPVAVPVTHHDEKLEKITLPPIAPSMPAQPVRSAIPAPVTAPPSQPVLPTQLGAQPIAQAIQKPLPKLDELPKISVSPSEKIEFAKPELKPEVKPELKPEIRHEPRPEVRPEPNPELPVAPPLGKLQQVLEELSTEDLELPSLDKFEPQIDPLQGKLRKVHGPKYVIIGRYEEIVSHCKGVSEMLQDLQADNEKLGQIENETKTAIDSLTGVFDGIQKALLSVDEKLFKVS